MPVLLGIDTGGTYTDAVLLDDEQGVIGAAKALTTRHDLSLGIQNAVEAALPKPVPDIRLVSLSSILATNAIVEGKGSPICLLLIGYDPDENGVDRGGSANVLTKDKPSPARAQNLLKLKLLRYDRRDWKAYWRRRVN